MPPGSINQDKGMLPSSCDSVLSTIYRFPKQSHAGETGVVVESKGGDGC